MSKTTNEFAPEVRGRAVRMVFDHERDHQEVRLLRQADAGTLAGLLGRDLAALVPEASGLELAFAAAHFDPAEALRPGWPLHRRLDELRRRAPGRHDGPRVIAFGADAQDGVPQPLQAEASLRGGSLRGVGIDQGWIYATRTTGSVAKRKSTLWRARITGLDVGAYTRIRSADRTEEWTRVAADRNRVAVLTTRPVKRDGAFAEESWLAGTPRGKLIRTGRNYATDGGYQPLLVAGFTADRSALITVRRTDYAPAPATVQRVPLAGRGATRTIQVVAPMLTDAEAIGYDGNDDRLVAVGPDAAGTPSLGTAPAPWGLSGR